MPRLIPVSLFTALTLVGCVAQPTQKYFDPAPAVSSDYAPYDRAGTGILTGQVFLKTVGGEAKKGVGSRVMIAPATPDNVTNMHYIFDLGMKPTPGAVDPSRKKYTRLVIADADGRFEVRDLPAGDYLVASEVRWQAPSKFGLVNQGGAFYKRVTVVEGKATNVSLTQ